jgi:prepilin-type N-terminal cleavage/methylation domain-containing protein
MDPLKAPLWRVTLPRKPGSSQRGVSLPELMVVTGIAGIVGSVMVALCQPMLSASQAEHASSQEIQTMDSTLYRMQRDARQTDPNGVFVCTGAGATLACSQASNLTTPTDVTCLAMLTARPLGTGSASWDASGRPVWVGFSVYWLSADQLGTYSLANGFGSANVPVGSNPAVLNSDVIGAVNQAVSSSDAVTIALGIERLQSMVDVSTDRIALRLVGKNKSGGATAELSVEGDAYARN